MTRKRPFSAKQKKKQLHERRQRRQDRDGFDWRADDEPMEDTTEQASAADTAQNDTSAQASRQGGHKPSKSRHPKSKDGSGVTLKDVIRYAATDEAIEQQLNAQSDRHRFKLRYVKESRDELERRKRQARMPLKSLSRKEGLERTVEDFYGSKYCLEFPKRPAWDYSMSKEEILRNEADSFRAFLNEVLEHYEESQLSYFELNLETWRQLWRVLEMSDVLFLVVDARYAPMHFPPALFQYVIKKLNKQIVIVLNKCDLVGEPTTSSWKEYFHERFPGVEIVTFSSYHTFHSGNPASRRKYKRKLTLASGIDQLPHVWETMGLQYHDEFTARIAQLVEEAESSVAVDSDEEGEMDDEELDRRLGLTEDDEDRGDGQSKPSRETWQGFATSADVPSDRPEDQEQEDHRKYVTIGMVGQPNVGKSTILNSLVGKTVVSTSVTPGHTKHFQTYFLTEHIRLCDCPGLIFPSLIQRPLQILAGLYPVSQVREPYTAIMYLAERIDLVKILKLKADEEDGDAPWTAWRICEAWAVQRGFLTAKAARADVYRAANDILRHTVDGRIVLSFKPPGYFDRYGDLPARIDTVAGASGQNAASGLIATKKKSRYVVLRAHQSAPYLPKDIGGPGDASESSDEEAEAPTRAANPFELLEAADD